MGRKPKRQMGVALSDELRQKLSTASEAGGRSIAEEIRRRVEQSFEADAVDEATRELVEAVIWIADELNRQIRSSWALRRGGREALAHAIQAWLEITAPPRRSGPVVASDLMGPDDPPTLGRSIARTYQRFKAAIEKSTEELRREHAKGKKP
jgi:hypothetical protein